MGPVFEDANSLLAAAGRPIVAVGDVVSYHLSQAGHRPKIVVVDGLSEREPIEESVGRGLPDVDTTVTVENPPATVTAELVDAIRTALSRSATTRVNVNGEEDLAVLPALLLARDGTTVVYGQPGEGMVAVPVNEDTRVAARERLSLMDRDEEFWDGLRRDRS